MQEEKSPAPGVLARSLCRGYFAEIGDARSAPTADTREVSTPAGTTLIVQLKLAESPCFGGKFPVRVPIMPKAVLRI